MTRKAWLSLVMLVAGSGLLISSALAAPAARHGGTLRVATSAGYVVDPALAYDPVSWALEGATCSKLFSYPDEEGAAGARVIPEVARSFPAVSKDGGRTRSS